MKRLSMGTTLFVMSCIIHFAVLNYSCTAHDLSNQIDKLSDLEQKWHFNDLGALTTHFNRVNLITMPGKEAGKAAYFPGNKLSAGIMSSINLPVEDGHKYVLSFQLLRLTFTNGHYLVGNIFGDEISIDNHCMLGTWQDFKISARYRTGKLKTISFANYYSSSFYFRNPYLADVTGQEEVRSQEAHIEQNQSKFFPVGVYGGTIDDVETISEMGINTAVLSASKGSAAQLLKKAHEFNLKTILHCLAEPTAARSLADEISQVDPDLRPQFFYVADEPELRSIPSELLMRVRNSILENAPWARLATAMVRPRQLSNFRRVYDAVFMDQYPVPHQPLNWLGDSIREVRREGDNGLQIWAVVQAFGGREYTKLGWPRYPEPAEMEALAGSALAEGAEGILFYNWQGIAAELGRRQAVRDLCRKIKAIDRWLPFQNGEGEGIRLEMIGRVRYTPSGGPAVRVGHGVTGGERLVFLVNQTHYKAEVQVEALDSKWIDASELWAGKNKQFVLGRFREEIEPYGLRAYVLKSSLHY